MSYVNVVLYVACIIIFRKQVQNQSAPPTISNWENEHEVFIIYFLYFMTLEHPPLVFSLSSSYL